MNSLETMSVDQKLWIVETGSIRVHQDEETENAKE